LTKSADRVLNGIKNRGAGFKEINGYFASDLMVDKVRDVIDQLTELGDSVKADDIQTRLKTVREDAVRALKDRNELFVDGTNVIQFGKNKFNVNTQELALTIVPHDNEMCFHLSGTDFFEPVTDEGFLATQGVWNQEVVSENREVYRAEWLVWQFLKSAEGKEVLADSESWKKDTLLELVQRFMQPRYSESYVKGVHDEDAARLLESVLPIHSEIGLLRYGAKDRAMGMLFWAGWEGDGKALLAGKIRAHAKRCEVFGANKNEAHGLIGELEECLLEWGRDDVIEGSRVGGAARYLFEELTVDEKFVVSPEAADLVKKFKHGLVMKHAEVGYDETLEGVGDFVGCFEIHLDWLRGFVQKAQKRQNLGLMKLLLPRTARIPRMGTWLVERLVMGCC